MNAGDMRWKRGGYAGVMRNGETPEMQKSSKCEPEGQIGRFVREHEKKREAHGSLPVGKTDPRQRDDEIRSYEFRLPIGGNPDGR